MSTQYTSSGDRRPDGPLRYEIPVPPKYLNPPLDTIAAYTNALYKEDQFQWELEELAEPFSEETVERGWPWLGHPKVAKLLSTTLAQALEARPTMAPFLGDEQVHFGFALKELAERWKLGSSNWAVHNLATMTRALRRGDEPPTLGFMTSTKPKVIRLPAMEFQFFGNPPPTLVTQYVRARFDEQTDPQINKLATGETHEAPYKLLRNVEWYAMHTARLMLGNRSDDAIWELIDEWNERHPDDKLPSSLTGFRRVRKAVNRFTGHLHDLIADLEKQYHDALAQIPS